MKRFSVILMVVFVLGFCSNALALDLAGKFGLTGKGGIGIPIGDFADSGKAEMGFGFGASGEYFLTDQIGLGAYFDYNSFGVKDVDGASYKLINFGAFGKYIIPTNSNISPYLKVAAGLYQTKATQEIGSVNETLSFGMKFGLAVGGGVMFKASNNVLVGTEAMFHDAMVKNAEGDFEGTTYKLLYNLQYIQIHAGVTFLVGGK
ncbi:MAG: porin family protein [candidate division Zixibacteria bacterium]|nr:porin family protein [candidate division Zixibacteria bacterium]